MTDGPSVCAIDANVILRYLLRDDLKLYDMAASILEGVEDGHVKVICDPVNLGEVVWVMESTYRLPPRLVRDRLERLVQHPGFLVPAKERYLRAIELYEEIGDFGDACACAAALEDCDGRLYSFDRKLSGIPGVERLEHAGE